MIVALTVVILAAGQGKRMNSDLPKVLQPLAGRPLLAHVIATARELEPEAINIVYGHGGEAVHVEELLGDILKEDVVLPPGPAGRQGAGPQ